MNDLLERYVKEVKRRLPRRDRADVARELRSLLAESIDARVGGGRDVESATVAVLEDFGPPAAAAARYRPSRGLWIGPELLPAFRKSVAIALAVLGLLALIGIFWGLPGAENPLDELIDGLVDGITSFLSNSFQVVGVLLVVFVAIEWLGGGRAGDETWDPRRLPPLEDESQVSRSDLAIGIAFTTVVLAWLLLWRDSVGVYASVGGRVGLLLRPTEAFWTVIPWLMGVWAAEVVLDVWLLVRGRWTAASRVVRAALRIAGLSVLVALLRIDLLVLDPSSPVLSGLTAERTADLVTRVQPWIERLVRLGLSVAIVAGIFGIVGDIRGLVRPGSRKAES